MTSRFEIRRRAVAAIVAHATAAVPNECCGLLLGITGRIERASRARNVAAAPATKFLVSPDDHFAAIREARAAGLAVVGAYHSHPRGRAVPSETDLAEAFDDPEFVHVIVSSIGEHGMELAGYRLDRGAFVSVELVTVD